MNRGDARCSSFGIVATALVVSGLLAALPFAAHAQTDRPEVREIAFRGNRAFSDDALRAAIVNRRTECRFWFVQPFCWMGMGVMHARQYLAPRQLPLDVLRIERFYAERGYRDADADTAIVQAGEKVEVIFTIEEGVPIVIDSLGFQGLESVPPARRASLVKDLPIRVGDPLDAIRIDEARQLILKRLREVGYAHADVLIDQFIPAGTRRASLDFILDTGPEVRIGEIVVVGNQILDERSVRRMVPFDSGDLYNRRALEDGQRNLFGLDVVRLASVTEQGAIFDTVMPIRIGVQEGTLHRVRTAVGWSTSDCVNAEASWASRNFFGGARRLQIRARVANILAQDFNDSACPQAGSGEFADLDGQVSVALIQPWIFSPRNSFSASAFLERESLPDVFIREALGFNVALSRALAPGVSATLSWEPQFARLEAAELFFCSSFRACTEDDISLFRSSNWLAPVRLTLAIDRANQLFNPTAGYQATFSVESASEITASDFKYRRAEASAAKYIEIDDGTVLALRASGGVVTAGEFFRLDDGENLQDIVHPEKRFFSGGASSVRGFAENRLGPRVLSVRAERLLEAPAVGEPAACSPEEVFVASCDATGVRQSAFAQRPTGGTRSIGANLELRFPFDEGRFQFVPFVDAGQVWDRSDDGGFDSIEITPGVGFRYLSPVGPIRLDLGLRPNETDALRVISSGIRPFDPMQDALEDRIEVRGTDGTIGPIDWVRTSDLLFMDPRVRFERSDGLLNRVQLHISIGQAF
ncbi:MAG: BamA/TamA family outer membrane protein [Longimicrobiales bacterium]|nr:BamA/TamA family outer membrane protein [Longimicrobiales bacterium]